MSSESISVQAYDMLGWKREANRATQLQLNEQDKKSA